MLPGLTVVPGALAGGAVSYQIARSLRFRPGASTQLTRTFATPTSRQKMTLSVWLKNSNHNTDTYVFDASPSSGANGEILRFTGSSIYLYEYWGTYGFQVQTTPLFRDPGAWMHYVVAIDTTQAVASDRIKIFMSGVRVTSFSLTNWPAQNYIFSYYGQAATGHIIGRPWFTASSWYEGYMAEVYYVDGQQVDPSSFGQFDPVTGAWGPKKYSGSYGINGYYLDFKDNSSLAALGTDRSGNGNNWSVSNFSITAGPSNDSLVDVPTNYGSDTGVGGQVRGNYCTLTSLLGGGVVPVNGNLEVNNPAASWIGAGATFALTSGKWGFEGAGPVGGNAYIEIGFRMASAVGLFPSNYLGAADGGYSWGFIQGGTVTGTYFNNVAGPSLSGTFNINTPAQAFVDVDAGKMWFGVGGVFAGGGNPAAGTSPTYTFTPGTPLIPGLYADASSAAINFGQRPFTPALQSGFKAICTANLPDPVIKNPSKYFDVVTRTGAGTGGSVTSLGFQPDTLWSKTRSNTVDHYLFDSVRNFTKILFPSLTDPEDGTNLLAVAPLPNGYSYGSYVGIDGAGRGFVEWLWKKGVLPGIDVVNVPLASAAAIPHALGVKPAMIIIKSRGGTGTNWFTAHRSLGDNMNDNVLVLNTTQANQLIAGCWGGEPTATQFYAGNTVMVPNSNFIAYLFAEVPGFSKFGSYYGTGTAEGEVVWCGFRPRWVMVKSWGVAGNWYILDGARDQFNPVLKFLSPNTAAPEGSTAIVDFLATGFKLRIAASDPNTNGQKYIYAAFAETPFKYARAR
jgi:hypothetical protein